MQAKCYKCGFRVAEGQLKFPQCGSQQLCLVCRAPLLFESARFCNTCGHPVAVQRKMVQQGALRTLPPTPNSPSEVKEKSEASAKNEQANPVALGDKKETRVPSDSENASQKAANNSKKEKIYRGSEADTRKRDISAQSDGKRAGGISGEDKQKTVITSKAGNVEVQTKNVGEQTARQNQSDKKDLSKDAVEHDDDEDTDDDASSNAPTENDPVSNYTRNAKKKQALQSQTQKERPKIMERKKNKLDRNKAKDPTAETNKLNGRATEHEDKDPLISNPLMDKDKSYASAAKTPKNSATRDSVSATSQKSTRQQTKPPPNLSRSSKDNEIKVDFFAILNSTGQDGKTFGVVFGEPVGDWEYAHAGNVESLANGTKILRRTIFVPYFPSDTSQIPYKYVIMNDDGTNTWEDNQSGNRFEGITNRCLILSKNDAEKGCHCKYDDFVDFGKSPVQSQGVWKRVSYFSGSSDQPAAKEEFFRALESYLPAWDGFQCGRKSAIEGSASRTTKDVLSADSAITKVVEIIHSLLSSTFWTKYQEMVSKFQFTSCEKLQIFRDIFEKKVYENVDCLDTNSGVSQTCKSLVSAVAIAHLFKTFIPEVLSYTEKKMIFPLLRCLSLRNLFIAGMKRNDIEQLIKEEFGTELSREIGHSLKSLLSDAKKVNRFKDEIMMFFSVLALINLFQTCSDQSSPDVSDILKQLQRPKAFDLKIKEHLLELEATVHFDRGLEPKMLPLIDIKHFIKIVSEDVFDFLEVLRALRKHIVSRWHSPFSQDEISAINDTFHNLTDRCKNQRKFQDREVDWLLKIIDILLRLLTNNMERIPFKEYFNFYHHLVLLLEGFFEAVSLYVSSDKKGLAQVISSSKMNIAKGMKSMSTCFKEKRHLIELSKNLKFLDFLLKINLPIEELKSYLDEEVVHMTKSLIKENMEDYEKILAIVCKAKSQSTSATMIKIFGEVAFEIVDVYTTGNQQATIFKHLSSSSLKNYLWKMVEEQFSKSMTTKEDILKKFLEWPLALSMIKLDSETRNDNHPGQKMLKHALETFTAVANRLNDATITVDELYIVHKFQDQFVKISKQLNRGAADAYLSLRWNEYLYFTEWKKKVERMLLLCEQPRGITVQMDQLKNILTTDISQAKLCSLCSVQDGELKIGIFSLPEELEAELSKLYDLADNRIFSMVWDSTRQKVKIPIDLDNVMKDLYDPVKSKLHRLIDSLFRETITLKEIDRIFKVYSVAEKTEELKNDIKLIVGKIFDREKAFEYDLASKTDYASTYERVINKAAKKIVEFFTLLMCQKKAENVIEVGKNLKLKGDFSIYNHVHQTIGLSQDNVELKTLTESHFGAANSLKMVTDEMGKCLKNIRTCSSIINWLREKLNHLRDVKTFVDLMSISAGESDYEADRIFCLHTVCLAFQPIIFELTSDAGPAELIDRCKDVLEEIHKDPSLPEKLLDCNRQLEWFKKERESYGSIATSSMMETEAANHRGYYTVGAIQETNRSVTLEKSLRLIVPDEANGGKDETDSKEKKTYSIDEIRDLQSKLMLIGGNKGRQRDAGQMEKDCFFKMFTAVSRVAIAYVDLCRAGCSLYLKWEKTFPCNLDDPEDFEQTVAKIESQSNEMEVTLDKWRSELHELRWKHQNLNFYTIQQLMFLQKELHEVLDKNGNLKALQYLPAQVFTLLEGIYPEMSITVFIEALLKSEHVRRYGNLESKNDDWKNIESEEGRFSGVPIDSLMTFVSQIEGEGFEEDVAKAATMHCGIKDVPEAIAWAAVNEDDESLVENLSKKIDDILSIKRNKKANDAEREEKASILALDDDDIKDSIGSKFIDETQFLSLDELGVFLSELGNLKKRKKTKSKQCEIMSANKPNVMVVPGDDLLLVLLKVYKETGNCLPKAEEVLVCSANTTAEEIELLFRRALMDTTSLYSLAYIDQLDYNVSEQAFRMLERLCKERAAKDNITRDCGYNLLLLCASGKEDVSFLASALHGYRIASPTCPDQLDVATFLEHQFKIDASTDSSKYLHAAAADRDCFSVRVVKSHTPGTGKSLYVQRVGEKLGNLIENSKLAVKQVCRSVDNDHIITTPLHGTTVLQDEIVQALLPYEKTKEDAFPRIYHFDISSTVTANLDLFLFDLIVLGSVASSDGKVWRKRSTDLCMLEITEIILHEDIHVRDQNKKRVSNVGTVVPLLPLTLCQTPKETFSAMEENINLVPGFDVQEFRSVAFQRVYQYLKMLGGNENAIDRFRFSEKEIRGDLFDCLRILLRYCGVQYPSWREIKNFVHFFNNQLFDCENSVFCIHKIVGDTLPGFKTFVVKFMLQMAKDFATPSVDSETEMENGLVSLRRRWEQSEHPYLFFNQCGQTMSFLGFTVNRNGDLMDKFNRRLIAGSIMTRDLFVGLQRQGVELFSDYERWNRAKKLSVLCQVMGINTVYDPDKTYELTMDNLMKILAIHMRFRSEIPVIIMGETGCGKTHLIRFMCKLKAGPGGPNNMLLVKVHGGVTKEDIKQKVHQAVTLAQENRRKRHDLETVLFFDEANTTDAVGLIKEVTCDQRIAGKALNLSACGLQVIAACNPYRKHSDNMIFRLESAGLGYHVKAEDTAEKLGKIPLRHLVYRVHRLPDSMLPLVWDFGQLSDETENIYTKQIVYRYARQILFSTSDDFLELVIATLSHSQKYMRDQQNECSFVSLRDVERAVQVMSWFFTKMDKFLPLIEQTKERLCPAEGLDNLSRRGKRERDEDSEDDNEEEDDEEDEEEYDSDDNQTFKSSTSKIENNVNVRSRMALVLALNVCYAARLEKRDPYYEKIASFFDGDYALIDGCKQIKDEVYYCQQMFLDQLQLADDIAKNTALCENVFMMVVCIELRIPLFVLGKPGSSKSLAKTIIQDNMQGSSSYSDLFKTFKQILMCSYQCSPLSTAEGIIRTFKQCSRFQEGQNLDSFASVVVLDEVGLAEDSPRMPLKALHPLLEDGTDGSEELTLEGSKLKSKRVAFVGISNWALDPAKMNRGLMLTRGQPDRNELVNSAEGIYNSDPIIKEKIKKLFLPLSEAYLKIYEQQKQCERLHKSKKEEFFGLRDYYSLVKMIFNRAKSNRRFPLLLEIEHAVKRNFGGLEEINVWDVFYQELFPFFPQDERDANATEDVDCSNVGLLRSSLQRNEFMKDGRYLLLLTENYAALRVLEKMFPDVKANANVIFGSSFPKDQEFTQICRDINKIKICMETGMTVILLNMENRYESLYDALNQYYIFLGGQRYVDLGLGTHRVKCRVHDDFRLIVVAEKDTVYRSFPIPLINRLEKHFLVMSTMMNERQLNLAKRLNIWASDFATISHGRKKYSIGDAFIGYNDDTAAAVILETVHDLADDAEDEIILSKSKERLLESATPEAVTRLTKTPLSSAANDIWNIYFNVQRHSSLSDFLWQALQSSRSNLAISAQVTTFSRLLSPHDQSQLSECLNGICSINFISLSQFRTEQQFSEEIRQYMNVDQTQNAMLIVQCDRGDEKANLIACARHLCEEERKFHADDKLSSLHIIFIVNLMRVVGGCKYLGSFHGVSWLSAHIDELRPPSDDLPSLVKFADCEMSYLFKSITQKENEVTFSVDEEIKSTEVSDEKELLNTSPGSVVSDDTGNVTVADVPLEELEKKTILDDENFMEKKHEEHPSLSLQLGLLRRCVQESVAEAVKQSNGRDAERTTKRIYHLLDLLSPDRSFEEKTLGRVFAETLLNLIHKVLKQKEQQMIDSRKQWFQDEAISGNNIQECGTFRRALSYRVEKEVLPIFARIIAMIDTNWNLDLIAEDIDWKRETWLKLFSCSDIVRLDYDVVSSVSNSGLPKQSRRYSAFICWFPFSNIVSNKVSSIVYAHQKDDSQSEDVIRLTFKQTYSGQCLLSASPSFLKAYLRDLIFMEFDVNDVQHEIIAHSILHRVKQKNLGKKPKPTDIVEYHLVICDPLFRKRVQCFLTLTNTMPDVMAKIRNMIMDAGDVVMDTVALRQCLYDLVPEYDELRDEQSRFIWCRKLHEIKLGTNELLDLFNAHQLEFSQKNLEIFSDIRRLLIKLQILRMFVEHVCPPGIPCSHQDVTAALKLYGTIDDIGDEMSSAKSWRKLEDFLKHVASVYNSDENHSGGDCFVCLEPIEDDPVQLPCMHVVCYSCIKKWQGKDKDTCPVCSARIPEEFKIHDDKDKREMTFELGEIKRRCISFFMEVVSTFCFSSKQESPIDTEVIDLMMSYVTTEKKQTKALSPFQNYGVDPTSTVRSFLIQQLLKIKDASQVKEYLQKYLNDNSQETQYGIESRLELCLLLVHCMEDIEMATISRKGFDANVQIPILTAKLERMRSESNSSLVTDIASLQAISEMRATLNKLADIVYSDLIENKWSSNEEAAFKVKLSKAYSLLKDVCMHSSSDNPKNYFLRQLLRLYGSNAMRDIIKCQEFKWLWPEDGDEECNLTFDWFIVHGTSYKDLREKIAEAILKKSVKDLESCTENGNCQLPDAARNAFCQLAIVREITSSSRRPSDEFCKSLFELMKPNTSNTSLLRQLLDDGQSNNFEKLNFTQNINQRDQAIAELVMHTQTVLSVKKKDLLLQPLSLMMLGPSSMTDSYLPTMPDNPLAIVLEALKSQKQWITYECPNGHAYVVTECGRPTQQQACGECGVLIGGRHHRLNPGNVQAARPAESSEKGYILGDAAQRVDFPVAERLLSTTSVCVIRVLLHSTLLLASCSNENDVAKIIHPAVNAGDAKDFFWAHLVKDINILSKSIGSSIDDAALLMHMVLAEILRNQEDRTTGDDFRTLSSKECRKEWEKKFDSTFVKPSLADLSTNLDKVQEALVNDKRLGSNPMMQNLYKVDRDNQPDNLDMPAFEYNRFWCYRTPISVDRLNISLAEFVAKKGKAICKMLQEFLDKEKTLRLVNKLPDMLKLQGIMSRCLNQKINSDENRSIIKVIDELFKGKKHEDVVKLVKSYFASWRAIQPLLLSDRKYADNEHFKHRLTTKSPVSYILPSTTGPGYTALTAVELLARSHNDLIETARRIQGDETEMKTVLLQDVTMAHLVAYDYDKDLLPMLYSHCDYSLELGKGTNVDYNFPALERQLVDTFIRGKPLVEIKLQKIRYLDEVNSFTVLKELEMKVNQVAIPFDEQAKMTAEFSNLSEVCDALRAAQITLGLLAAGAKPDFFYKNYLKKILRMSVSQFLASGMMQSVCRLAHIRSIWLMLNVERAYRLYLNKEDPFDVDDKFREKFEEDKCRVQLLQNVDVDHLISELTEYIILELPSREDNALDYPLASCLEDYSDRKSSTDVKGIEFIHENICLKHIYEFWLLVAKAYSKHKKI